MFCMFTIFIVQKAISREMLPLKYFWDAVVARVLYVLNVTMQIGFCLGFTP